MYIFYNIGIPENRNLNKNSKGIFNNITIIKSITENVINQYLNNVNNIFHKYSINIILEILVNI